MNEVIYKAVVYACIFTICWLLYKLGDWLDRYNASLEEKIKETEEKIQIQKRLKEDITNHQGCYQSQFMPELDEILNERGIITKEA